MFYETPYQLSFFFFQAEDGIRDIGVTGVQTCALPISLLLALQILGHLPVALGLGAQVVDHGVEEVLRKLGVELLSRDGAVGHRLVDRKSTRLNSSHANISYAVFCLKKKNMLY